MSFDTPGSEYVQKNEYNSSVSMNALSDKHTPEVDYADYVIQVNHIGKQYNLYDKPQDRLKHTLFWRFGRSYGRPFWALRDVTFNVARGETFGIIGRNGSGKSTLLQILAGIVTPTTGDFEVKGRIATLLELGSGFNLEYSGRDNVYINGSILGIPPDEMRERINEIIAFADIGEYIDQPVKLYSSGMFIRLAFAVAVSVDADILLIDEALAVGDVFFRQRCYQKLESLRQNGVSIILVSHAMNEVEQFCNRALLLNNGEMVFKGSAVEAVKRFYLLNQQYRSDISVPVNHTIMENQAESETSSLVEIDPQEPDNSVSVSWPSSQSFYDLSILPQVTNGWGRFLCMAICDKDGNPCRSFEQGETAYFYMEYQLEHEIEVPICGLEIVNDKGTIVYGKNTLLSGSTVPIGLKTGTVIRFLQEAKLDIAIGDYTFNIGVSTINLENYKNKARIPHAELDSLITVLGITPNAGHFTVTFRKHGTPVQLLHFGVADLPDNLYLFKSDTKTFPDD